ncbi:hypothetical protein D9M72_585660 [compost metagenome]
MEVTGNPVAVSEDQQLFPQPVDPGQFKRQRHVGPENGSHLHINPAVGTLAGVPDQEEQAMMCALGAERHCEERTGHGPLQHPQHVGGLVHE